VKYKSLNKNGHGPYSGFNWPKPVKNEDGTWEPGEWVEAEGPLEMCANGVHYCDDERQLLKWLDVHLYEIDPVVLKQRPPPVVNSYVFHDPPPRVWRFWLVFCR